MATEIVGKFHRKGVGKVSGKPYDFITTLVLLRVLLKRWTAACQKGSFAAF